MVCILDGSVKNSGRKVIRTHVATYCYSITAGSFDLVDDGLQLLFVETGLCA